MTGPTAADCAASRRGGIKVAVFAALGMVAAVITYAGGHSRTAVLIAVAVIAAVLAEGRPKAARARRRWPP